MNLDSSVALKWISSTTSAIFGKHIQNTHLELGFGEGGTKIHLETHKMCDHWCTWITCGGKTLCKRRDTLDQCVGSDPSPTSCNQVHINPKCRNMSWAILPHIETCLGDVCEPGFTRCIATLNNNIKHAINSCWSCSQFGASAHPMIATLAQHVVPECE